MTNTTSVTRVHRALAAVGLIALATPALGQTVARWPASEGGNDHYYAAVRVADGESATWPRCRDLAVQMQGRLASITSAEESRFVFSLVDSEEFWGQDELGNNFGPWLGGTQPAGSAEPDGGWLWVSGEAWDYTNWLVGEPNNLVGSENSLHLFSAAGQPRGAGWNDERQGRAFVRAFVAEFDCLYVLEQPGDQLLCRDGHATFRLRGDGPGATFRWQAQFAAQPWRDLAEGRTPAACGDVVASNVATADLGLTIEGCGSSTPFSFRVRCVMTTSCANFTSTPATVTHCPADLTCDSFLDFFDYERYIAMFEAGEPGADFGGDGFIDFFDYLEYLAAFEAGC